MAEFNIKTDYALNLIKSADGMKPYDPSAGQGWKNYPQRPPQFSQLTGFNPDLTINEDTFIKNKPKGGIDALDTSLAMAQLDWDRQINAKQATDANKVKGKQLKFSNLISNAQNMLYSIFFEHITPNEKGSINPKYDTNNNGLLDAADVQTLAALDGDPATLSNQDLLKAQSTTGIK